MRLVDREAGEKVRDAHVVRAVRQEGLAVGGALRDPGCGDRANHVRRRGGAKRRGDSFEARSAVNRSSTMRRG